MGLLNSILGGGTKDNQWQLYFSSDLHGSNKCFRKFVNARKFYDADVLVLGGDLTGKAIVPVVEDSDRWRVEYPHRTKELHDESAVEETIEQINNAGNYPVRLSPTEYQAFRDDSERIDSTYETLEKNRIQEWVEFAERKQAEDDLPIFLIAGNDDAEYVVDQVIDSPAFELIDGRVTSLPSGHELFGYGWSNPTPWDTPREKSEAEIEADLNSIGDRVEEWDRAIANIHCPPYDTQIDEAPKLNEDLRPVTSGGTVVKEPVGSVAVREFIESRQPLLGLHGHIHESQGTFSLGNTLCVNPGSEYGEGYLNGVLLTIAEDSITRHQFTSG